jgi:hypothetical protein|tara:strand:- start:47 stop:817 length:771 start_codon:yes stop_codon:yes gene_type:complete
MTEFQTQFDSPEDAYLGFFAADASQIAEAWAAVMNYPHARVAASGVTDYFETPKAYGDAANVDWPSRVKTGWVRTRGRETTRLHDSATKVHLVGGWIRLNADDEPIRWNRVTYIATKPADSWGIQARFALGAYDGSDDHEAAEQAAEVATSKVQQYYEALRNNDSSACAALCRYPLMDVGVGEVTQINDAATMAQHITLGQISNLDISAAQAGPDGVNVAVTADYSDGRREQSILVVGHEGDSWQIAGISTMPGSA